VIADRRPYTGPHATAKQQNQRSLAQHWTATRISAILAEKSGVVRGREIMGMFLRWLFAFLLLAATYNPTQWNYVRWAAANYDTRLSIAVLLGLLLLIAYIIYTRATIRSIGGFGMTLVIALVASVLWVLHDLGLLSLDNQDENIWLGILALSAVLGIGLSWSHVRRHLSGQADMDDLDS
jgi:hypothetical protein